ncbi:MAG: alanine racemase [Firmicutes bacterium]|nr:alanine racemase [Bacillota bacterium]
MDRKEEFMYRKTYVEVNLDNIEYNTKQLLNTYNKYEYYFGVVKGFAYGHGFNIINTLINNGINYLAVSNLQEALEIRKINKEVPVLCLEPIDYEHLELCSINNITITVSSTRYAKLLETWPLKLKIHIKIDSGMNRLGFDNSKDLESALKLLKTNNNLTLEGIYTHMGTLGISDPYWDRQLEEFKRITQSTDLNEFKIIHIDRSATMMCHEKIDFCNGVRMGLALYGYNQFKKQPKSLKNKFKQIRKYFKIKKYNISKTNTEINLKLKPAMSLITEVIEIKTVKKGEFIGYFGHVNNEPEIKVATASIGYADGIDLRATGAPVFINGKRFKIIGTINMGMISIQVDNSIKPGDKVEIFGNNIKINETSSHVNTTIYETMTTISPLLPRVYINNNISGNEEE